MQFNRSYAFRLLVIKVPLFAGSKPQLSSTKLCMKSPLFDGAQPRIFCLIDSSTVIYSLINTKIYCYL